MSSLVLFREIRRGAGPLDAPPPIRLPYAVNPSTGPPVSRLVPETGAPLSTLRGYLALFLVLSGLLLCDPVQRFVVAPAVRLFPSRRGRILTRWQQALARFILRCFASVGGAHIPKLPHVPADPGTLVIMNHQSVLDIPLVVASMDGSYPLIVTRRRYFRWIPLISHMLRLYQYPEVDPTANTAKARKMLTDLSVVARDAAPPVAIFPEGTRTRDGEIGRFKTRGLRKILSQRSWTIWVLVTDGFWERAKMKHFVGGMGRIDGRIEMLGPFRWEEDEEEADPREFIDGIRERMIATLSKMRVGLPA
jgi:1-acyl-sn-glycerol-3-phosphate acyltransferase